MENNKTAKVIFAEFVQAFNDRDFDKVVDSFAEDGFLIAPYSASVGFDPIIKGKENIIATLESVITNAPDFSFRNLKIVMETPTEIVAEYESTANMANGRSYEQQYIAHIITRDGKIAQHREFLNMIIFAKAFLPNGLSDLIEA